MLNILPKLIQPHKENIYSTTRNLAISLLKKKGLPSPKSEVYKYTNISKILLRDFSTFSASIDLPSKKKTIVPELSKNQLVIVNGLLQGTLLDYSLPKGISIKKLEEEKQITNNDIDKNSDEFLLLNISNLNTGLVITAKKGEIIKEPVVIIHVTDSSKNQAVTHPRIVVNAEENSQTTIIELFIGSGTLSSFTNSVTEINCESRSIVDYIKIGNENIPQLHVGNTQVNINSSATLNSVTLNLGRGVIRNNLVVTMNGKNSEANLYGLYIADNKEHIDNYTVINHKVAHCSSNEVYKGIMDGSSKGVFNGKIVVQPDAQITQAFQSNKNILLSDNAVINTKPQLEIWANDVKCSHGCTTGKIDEEQIFYFKSRGIDENSAKLILLNAYASEIVKHIGDEKVKSYIQNIIYEKLLKK